MLIALLAFAPFAPALNAEFVTWDDNRNFLDNPHYRGLGRTQLRWMWTSFHMGHYIPLSWMSLGLDYELWAMNPLGYHLQNVVLHAANAVLVYFVARRILTLTGSIPAKAAPLAVVLPCAVAALLFAVHPLRVESVAWITERRDMLSLLFYLSSVLCYLPYRERPDVRRRWYYLSLVLFACALLSKATSVTLPVVLFILNVYPLRRIAGRSGFWTESARQVYAELAPFALLAAAAAAVSLLVLHPPSQLSPIEKFAVSAYSLAFYLWKTIAPTGLAPLYEMPKRIDPVAPRYLLSYGVVVALTVGAWIVRRRWPGVTTAWFAFVAIILPMLGIVQNGPQIAADRYTYHAAPVLGLLAGAGFARWRRPPTAARVMVVAGTLCVFALLTWHQASIWRDSERLWSRVLGVDSTSSIAHIAMGDLLIAQDRVDEAVRHYGRGVELDPTFAGGYNNLGVALARQGRASAAIERYAQALRLNPSFGDAHNNWGIALSQLGDFGGAIGHYQQAIALDPRNADAHVNYGNALVRVGQPADAMRHYEVADRTRPGHADTHLNWGVALAQLGKLTDAADHFTLALSLDPQNAEARAFLERAARLQAQPNRSGQQR